MEETTLRAYLLGLLLEEEQGKVEKWWMEDESGRNKETFQRVARVLKDAYRNNELDLTERDAFEKDGKRLCRIFLRKGHS